jgi:hypothetical protein
MLGLTMLALLVVAAVLALADGTARTEERI